MESPSSPSFSASTSLTPPSAASRFVCIQMAETPFVSSFVSSLPCGLSSTTLCTLCQVQFITGWCATISSAPRAIASSATRSVTSSAISTRVTARLSLPTSSPTLSQLSAKSRGAQS